MTSTDGIIVNDFHIGALDSICPPEVKVCLTEENGKESQVYHRALEIQKEVYNKWICVTEACPPLDFLFINGDMTDGRNPKGKGEGLWTENLRAQSIVCVDLLEMLPMKKDVVIRISFSSAYHAGHNPSTDELIYQEFRARGYTNVKVDYDWPVQINDMKFHFNHKVGVAQNDVTSLEKEMMWAKVHQTEYGHIDGIIRAHCHIDSHIEKRGMYGWIVPGWKARDEYVKAGGLRYNPTIGCLILHVPENGSKDFKWNWMKWALKKPLSFEKII